MLLQQLESMHSFQLEDSYERSWLYDDDMPSSTPSNSVANYNHSNTSILHKQSTFKTIKETPTGRFISLPFITDIESVSPDIPTGHVDNNTIST